MTPTARKAPPQAKHLLDWKRAMASGLMDGLPFGAATVQAYLYYVDWSPDLGKGIDDYLMTTGGCLPEPMPARAWLAMADQTVKPQEGR